MWKGAPHLPPSTVSRVVRDNPFRLVSVENRAHMFTKFFLLFVSRKKYTLNRMSQLDTSGYRGSQHGGIEVVSPPPPQGPPPTEPLPQIPIARSNTVTEAKMSPCDISSQATVRRANTVTPSQNAFHEPRIGRSNTVPTHARTIFQNLPFSQPTIGTAYTDTIPGTPPQKRGTTGKSVDISTVQQPPRSEISAYNITSEWAQQRSPLPDSLRQKPRQRERFRFYWPIAVLAVSILITVIVVSALAAKGLLPSQQRRYV